MTLEVNPANFQSFQHFAAYVRANFDLVEQEISDLALAGIAESNTRIIGYYAGITLI